MAKTCRAEIMATEQQIGRLGEQLDHALSLQAATVIMLAERIIDLREYMERMREGLKSFQIAITSATGQQKEDMVKAAVDVADEVLAVEDAAKEVINASLKGTQAMSEEEDIRGRRESKSPDKETQRGPR